MSSSYVIPSLGAEKSQHLWELIKAKLASLNLYTDDVLSEYIMVLLHGGNSKEKIYEELVIFMNSPEVAEHFVLWLFGEVERLGNVVAPVIPASVAVAVPFVMSQVSESVAFTPLEAVDVQMGGSSSAGTRLQGTRNFSKALEGVINPNNSRKSNFDRPERSERSERIERSYERIDRGDYDPYKRDERLPRVTRSRNRSASPQRSSTRRIVRSSQEDDSRGIQKVRLSVDFDRDERRRSPGHKSSFRKQLQTDEDPSSGPQEPNKIRVKCPFWPSCRAGDACPNVHPSETCKHFPNCQFGDDCTFVHPSIPCKFQEKCQNPLCNYQHRPSAAFMPSSSAISSGGGSSTILCKFYPRCVNINCPYLHPVKVQCRYGVECSRPDCPFEHASGRKGAHLKSVVFAPCKYGKQCARADCPYQHPLEDSTLTIPLASYVMTTSTSPDPAINPDSITDMQS